MNEQNVIPESHSSKLTEQLSKYYYEKPHRLNQETVKMYVLLLTTNQRLPFGPSQSNLTTLLTQILADSLLYPVYTVYVIIISQSESVIWYDLSHFPYIII